MQTKIRVVQEGKGRRKDVKMGLVRSCYVAQDNPGGIFQLHKRESGYNATEQARGKKSGAGGWNGGETWGRGGGEISFSERRIHGAGI